MQAECGAIFQGVDNAVFRCGICWAINETSRQTSAGTMDSARRVIRDGWRSDRMPGEYATHFTLVLPPVFPRFGSGVTSPAVALVAACSLACSRLWWRFAGQLFSCLRGCVGQPGCGGGFGGVAAPAACVQWAPGAVVCHCPWPGQAVGSNSALHRTAFGSR